MKFIHLSDLHLGKRLNEYSLIEEQMYILEKIIEVIDDEKADAVIIAGDIYDKSIPPSEAVKLLDEFLTKLSKRKTNTYIISGNHDSAERIAFGSKIMSMGGIYLSEVFKGDVTPCKFTDEYGTVNIYLLPFIKPANINSVYNINAESYTEAMKYAIQRMNIDKTQRNILVTHQNVLNAKLSGSETSVIIGNLDAVNADVFLPFDYTALGHIHSAQNIIENKVRYCGTPLKYSLSEANLDKSVTVVEMKNKGEVIIKEIPIIPKHNLREIKGKFEELINGCDVKPKDDYVYIALTDENDIPNAIDRLRSIYKNIMELRYNNLRTRKNSTISADREIEMKSPFEIFEDLYREQNRSEMSEEQKEYLKEEIDKIWGEDE